MKPNMIEAVKNSDCGWFYRVNTSEFQLYSK